MSSDLFDELPARVVVALPLPPTIRLVQLRERHPSEWNSPRRKSAGCAGDQLSLPLREHDRPLVLAAGAVLREQAAPVLPVSLDDDRPWGADMEDLHPWSYSSENVAHVGDDPRKTGVAGDAQRGVPREARQTSVSEVEPQQSGIGLVVVERSGARQAPVVGYPGSASNRAPRLVVETTADHVQLTAEQRYELISGQFPAWLLAEPIVFPPNHSTYGWACPVPAASAPRAR